MKRICLAIMLVLVLIACGQETTSGSYAIIVVVNDTEYNGAESDLADYEPDKMIGKITKEVPVDVLPANNQSNFFEEGTVISSVKGEIEGGLPKIQQETVMSCTMRQEMIRNNASTKLKS